MAAILLLSGAHSLLVAQGDDRTAADVEFRKEPGGTLLGRIERGAAVTFGATRDGWRETTLTGWMAASSLRNDSRDGFDVAVSIAAGAPLRTTPSDNAPVRATAVAGALFDRVESRGGWVQVRRTAWIPASAVGEPVTDEGQRQATEEVRQPATTGDGQQAVGDSARVAIAPGSESSVDRAGGVSGRV
ncbi:MAG TPA: SH3 domain-containing protein, partial [Gemmatimonadales bacterium]|nr:SH3 domain-containing protein [Gemmatimonadales bacterium]